MNPNSQEEIEKEIVMRRYWYYLTSEYDMFI